MVRRSNEGRPAKYTRPQVGTVFRRARLFRALIEQRHHACTWIKGPPGCGKTTLIADYVSELVTPCLWYRVDADDIDPAAFFAHLTVAVRAELGEVAHDLPSFSAGGGRESVESFGRAYFRDLFAAAPNLMLVLDDLHSTLGDSALNEVLPLAVEQVPRGGGIVVTSRADLPPSLARCRINGMVGSISWDQLKLTPDEVIDVAAAIGVELDRAEASTLHDRCGGWVTGLLLTLNAGGRRPEHDSTNGSRTLLFAYLEREVFLGLPDTVQAGLLHLAFLPRVPLGLAFELTGSRQTERHLAVLADEGFLTTLTLEGCASYRLPAFFRDFLIHRAKFELRAEEVVFRRRRAVVALLGAGLIDEVAQVLIDAQDWEQLGELVRSQAPQMMMQAQQMTLARWLSHMPITHVEADPWLLYWFGACRSICEPYAARVSLEAAFARFKGLRERAGILLAWAGVVDCIVHIYANLAELDPWIERLEGLLTADASFPSTEVEAKVAFSMFVTLSFRQPQHPGLPKWRQRLEAMAHAVPDPMYRIFARLHLAMNRVWQGDLHVAKADIGKLQREIAHGPSVPVAELVGKLAQSTHALYAGHVEAAFTAIEEALAIAETSNVHIWDKVLLGQGAALALSHGELARGRMYAQRRASIARPADDEEQALSHLIEAWSCWQGGQLAESLANVQLGINSTERMGLPHFKAVGCLSFAIVSFECGDEALALSQVETGRTLGLMTRNPMLDWMADLLEAYMRLRRGEAARALIASGMGTGRRHGYQHFFFWPREALALVCLEALDLDIERDYVTRLIEQGRLAPPRAALESDRWPRPVRISTLGSFTIVVRGKPVGFKGKVQRAPLNLLKALIAFGGRDVPESRLIDALWPDSDGAAGAQALATTLFRLRKIIGADAVTRQGGRLSIEGSVCRVDCLAFERLLKSETSGAVLVERVRREYAGRFLREEEDAPWALAMRERLHMALVKKLAEAGRAALAEHRFELARDVYEVGLEVDDLAEDFHRGLIQCHIAADQTSLAVDAYRRCQRTLSQRLGVEPSAATTRLYLATIRAAEP